MNNASIESATRTWFVSCPKGLETLLLDELISLGVQSARSTVAGVSAEATLEQAYRWCLWSRLANRVLLMLSDHEVSSADDIYAVATSIDWQAHFDCEQSFAIYFAGTSDWLRHTHFGSLRIKDAIVDQFRARTGARPNVDARNPDVQIQATLRRGKLIITLDFSGDSLHRRGYRTDGAKAPLKENLAAALLIRAGWPERTTQQQPILDPFCGSGTLVIEAALFAADIAPGVLRDHFGFERWKQHEAPVWRGLLADALARRAQGMSKRLPVLEGYDADPRSIEAARANASRAGLQDICLFAVRDVAQWAESAASGESVGGVVVSNPPHGERLGDIEVLMPLYEQLGEALRKHCAGWSAAIFTPHAELAQSMRMRSDRRYQFFNGALECVLWCYWQIPAADGVNERARDEGIEAFANRLQKNVRQVDKWARQNGIECYRIYDADLPEYAVSIDRYGQWIQIAEYAAPKSIDMVKARRRLQAIVRAVPTVLGIPSDFVSLKQRERQRGDNQYQKQAQTGRFTTVREGNINVRVNLWDYLDTGLFLDHRPIRLKIAQWARGKHFLNLFCYTGVASVHAAAGGALSTTNVDMSATYLDWAEQNFALNNLLGNKHQFVQKDCMQWLEDARTEYDLIFLDPPTFSNSKRMEDTLDIQRDHVWLIDQAMRILSHDGVLIFSNNLRKFRLDDYVSQKYQVENYTTKSIDKDFARNPRIHQCYLIKHT